ncbi:MAG: DNA gyrase subunit A [Lentisphaerae bacterium]|nr:DNA gyrase subunit A [Lentisphaerota bacterium]
MPTNQDSITNINIRDELQRSFLDYSMSVIVSRALPDVRDGMKPGARRILYAMHDMGLLYNRPYRKCAAVVGEVLGKYHPHGDAAVYDTLVRMAQPFSLRYTLVDGQGNFGCIDGDSAAAYRYTEARLARMASEMLADIDKRTVDMVDNYNAELKEPAVLPARLPNLLINGSTGIAVGMATNIPPHNIREVIDAVVALIDNPDATVKDLMRYLKGPDFPGGAIICGHASIASMYKTGRGQMRVRGRAEIEETKQGREAIIITEIPYMVNKAKLIENIARLANEKKIDGISDIRDESNNQGIRIVIDLKRGAIPKVVLNNIYKQTQLQATFGAIMLALENGRPKVMNLKEMLSHFIAHRFDVITRRTQFELEKAEARAHILEGLRIAVDNLDAVVKIIRASKNRDEARTELCNKFSLSEIQANAILDMRLYQLTGLERDKLEAEYLELIKLISELRDLLANRSKIYDVMRADLLDIIEIYGDERRTQIVPNEGEVNIEDLIANEACAITITQTGYIKRVPVSTYKAQRRGGRGVTGMGTKSEDFVKQMFVANTHDYMLFFTADGRVYWEKVYEIPEASRQARGKAIVNMLQLKPEETITAMLCVQEFSDDLNIVMASRNGIIKKSKLSAFKNPRRDGIIAMGIQKDDSLIGVKLTSGNDHVVLATRHGMSLRFDESEVRAMGRTAQGVRGIRLGKDDALEGLEIVDNNATFLVCTENGYGKRTSFEECRAQHRGGKGIFTIRTSKRNGLVIGALSVFDEDALMLITAKGMMIRMNVSDIRVISRVTQGVRLINLDEDDKLVSAIPVEPEDQDSDEAEANGTEVASTDIVTSSEAENGE